MASLENTGNAIFLVIRWWPSSAVAMGLPMRSRLTVDILGQTLLTGRSRPRQASPDRTRQDFVNGPPNADQVVRSVTASTPAECTGGFTHVFQYLVQAWATRAPRHQLRLPWIRTEVHGCPSVVDRRTCARRDRWMWPGRLVVGQGPRRAH